MKHCPICETEFYPNSDYQRYCSEGCRKKGQRMATQGQNVQMPAPNGNQITGDPLTIAEHRTYMAEIRGKMDREEGGYTRDHLERAEIILACMPRRFSMAALLELYRLPLAEFHAQIDALPLDVWCTVV